LRLLCPSTSVLRFNKQGRKYGGVTEIKERETNKPKENKKEKKEELKNQIYNSIYLCLFDLFTIVNFVTFVIPVYVVNFVI